MLTTPDSDDDWAELALELSRDKPQPPEQPPASEEIGLFGDSAEDVPVRAEEGIEKLEPDGDADGDGPPDGQPNTGRKRRRRRRRRRRGGGDQPESAAGAAGGVEPEETAGAEDVEASDVSYSDEEESDSDFAAVGEESSDEDAGEELLRDLIANWNVPSWDDVVAGLYRPER
jgi:hypothetical protein